MSNSLEELGIMSRTLEEIFVTWAISLSVSDPISVLFAIGALQRENFDNYFRNNVMILLRNVVTLALDASIIATSSSASREQQVVQG